MKAVDATLAHAQTVSTPFLATSDKRPLEDVRGDVTDEEDLEIEDTDCAVINRSTEIVHEGRYNGTYTAINGKRGETGMGPYINMKDVDADLKSEVVWTTPASEFITVPDVTLNGKTPYTNGTNGINGINGTNGTKVNGFATLDGDIKGTNGTKVNGFATLDGDIKGTNGTKVNGFATLDGDTKGTNGTNGTIVNGFASLDGDTKGTNGTNGTNGTTVNGFATLDGEKVPENGHRINENGKSTERAESPIANWDRTVAEMKEHAFSRLQDELKKAHQELKLRDEEVTRLSRIRQDVESELEDLTASLFQEAHNMVREANIKHAAAERAFKESQMQVEVLTAEVAALKTLVLTSTPSRPNPHLHPQIDLRGNRTKDDSSLGGAGSLFNKKHRRSPSHFNLKYGRENSPPDSPVREAQSLPPEDLNCKEGWEVDPDVHREFTTWRQNPKLDKCDPFIARIYAEEIDLCLDFPNQELSGHVRNAVESGNIFIEAVSDKTKTVFPKKCALLEVPRQCHYRMKFGDQEQWYCMSQICRNRIIAVCDFLNYLKYIERGLVKSSAHDVYWEITRLRKDMVLARLGLALAS